jgi:hypothetical protein
MLKVYPSGKGAGMSVLQISIQSLNRFFEVLPDEVEQAELMVEDAMGKVMLNLFGEGTVDDVTIHFSTGLLTGKRHCSIQIYGECPHQSFVFLPCTREDMELAVEKSIRCILKELFGEVSVDRVTISPSS